MSIWSNSKGNPLIYIFISIFIIITRSIFGVSDEHIWC